MLVKGANGNKQSAFHGANIYIDYFVTIWGEKMHDHESTIKHKYNGCEG